MRDVLNFFDKYAERERLAAIGSGSQNDTSGVCAFCGFASDDVLIGVCVDCSPTSTGKE